MVTIIVDLSVTSWRLGFWDKIEQPCIALRPLITSSKPCFIPRWSTLCTIGYRYLWLYFLSSSCILLVSKGNYHQLKKVLIVKQTLLVSNSWNVYRAVLKIWILMLRCKGLKKLWCGIGFNWPFVKIGDRELWWNSMACKDDVLSSSFLWNMAFLEIAWLLGPLFTLQSLKSQIWILKISVSDDKKLYSFC